MDFSSATISNNMQRHKNIRVLFQKQVVKIKISGFLKF